MPEDLAPRSLLQSEPTAALRFRDWPVEADRDGVRDLAAATGFFSAEEVAVAVELVEAHLAQGPASGYRFIFAERDGRLEGYVCFGPIPLTQSSVDLYWIAVRPDRQQAGLGRRLMDLAEARAREEGGTAIYVETSTRPQYEPTRVFYRSLGYRPVAEIPDFYAPGDGQAILMKRLGTDY